MTRGQPSARVKSKPESGSKQSARPAGTDPSDTGNLSDRIERYSLNYLARFGMTTKHHLRRKIKDKIARLGHAAEDHADRIETALAKLERAGLLNDLEAANHRIRRLRDRGWSLAHIRQDLIRRGISQEDLGRILDREKSDQNCDLEWQAAVRLAQRRKLGPWRLDSGERVDRARLQKEMRAFAARGFSYSTAKMIVESSSPESLLTRT